jgi:hypothetical protein
MKKTPSLFVSSIIALVTTSFGFIVRAESPASHAAVTAPAQQKFGLEFHPIDQQKAAALAADDRTTLDRLKIQTNHGTLAQVALLPVFTLNGHVGLMVHFLGKGGYQAVTLEDSSAPSKT